MSFAISPITDDDVPALVQLDEDAYEGNPLRESISSWHIASPEVRAKHLEWSDNMLRNWLRDDGTVFRKAVLEATGKPVGWAAWTKPSPKPDDAQQANRPSETKDTPFELSPCFNAEAAKEHMALWHDMMEKYMGGKDPYWCLGKLAVGQQHLKAADALVKEMIIEVNKSGLQAFTGSTPDTLEMYKENGFEVVEEVPRLGGAYSFFFMLREARGKQR